MLTPIKNYPALLYKRRRYRAVIIADLHLGWEMNLTQRGFHIPSQTPRIRQRLLELIDTTRPDTLLILGDVKHTIAKAELREWRDVPELLKTTKAEIDDVQIIRGNHDGNLEPLLHPSIPLHPATGKALDTIGLFHGHTWPAKELLGCKTLVMGHAHPTVALYDSFGYKMVAPVWMKVRCNTDRLASAFLRSKHLKVDHTSHATLKERFNISPKVNELLIMPCFNEFLGGRPVNKKRKSKTYIGPVLRSQATDLGEAELYFLDGTFLGTLKQLKTMG